MASFFPAEMLEKMTYVSIEEKFPKFASKFILKTLATTCPNLEVLKLHWTTQFDTYNPLEWLLKRINTISSLKEVIFSPPQNHSFQIVITKDLIDILKKSPPLVFQGCLSFNMTNSLFQNEFNGEIENIHSLYKYDSHSYEPDDIKIHCKHLDDKEPKSLPLLGLERPRIEEVD